MIRITPWYFLSGTLSRYAHPVNEMAVVGGVWVPMEMFLITSTPSNLPAGNDALNPSVATLGGWSNHMAGASTTMTLDSTSPISGPTSAMVTKDNAFGSLAFLRVTGGYVTPADDNDTTSPEFKAVTPIVGKVMAWSLDIKCDHDAQADVGVFTFDAAGGQIDGVEEIHVFPADVVTRIGCTFLTPPGSVACMMDITVDPQAATVVGTRTWFDNLLIELDSGRTYIPADVNGYHPAGVYDLDYYVDGDTPGYHWAGTPGASATVKDA